MPPLKPINEFTPTEVGMWLTAQGLGDHVPKFLNAGVDGDVLVSLDVEDYKDDLGLSTFLTGRNHNIEQAIKCLSRQSSDMKEGRQVTLVI
jgi:hypothetical protein